jgi:hypothetical protein
MEQLLENITKQIRPIIQDEFERHENAHRHTLFEFQSKKYDIPFSRLVTDWRNLQHNVIVDNRCHAMNGKGKICKNKSRLNGYCHLHASQYKPPTSQEVTATHAVQHNHTLPPLWKDGCPACILQKPFRDLGDCFNNNE